jgi:hypothetical protein
MKCEVCGEEHFTSLIDPRYTHVCHQCVEDGMAGIAEGDEVFRVILSCRCGNSGPVNYDDGLCIGYYCGSSQFCIP